VADDGLHFLLNVTGVGYHRTAWLDPGVAASSFVDVDYYQGVAQTAERGLFDALLLPDIPQQNAGIAAAPTQSLEPTLLCAALAMTTERVGFIPTLSTSFNRPYNLARRVLSLDHASNGRAGWNVVTTAAPGAAANFGQEEILPREDRYRRAAEFVALARRLWDGWEDGALVGDQDSGEFADPAKIHPAAHHGEFFDVDGPLNVPRSPQGRPVIVQAGASDPGIRFAATCAEVVYGAQLSLPGAVEFAGQVRAIAAAHGRDPDQIRFLPALVPVVAPTEQEAEERWELLQSRLPSGPTEAARLEGTLHLPAGTLSSGTLSGDLDAPLAPETFGRSQALHEGFPRAAARFAAETGYSARELGRHISGGHRLVVGSTRQVADHIEEWWRAGAVDGFTIAPPALTHDLHSFVDLVVPELQRRGIYRDRYPGQTLRANLGLPVPANPFAAPVCPPA
jgi:FMN-dependent oxidoreductase (nitrilotriacetate monooxygenase family)